MANGTDADLELINDLTDGFRRSKILFTAVELKLFDHLAEGPLDLKELTSKLNISVSSALERFLNSCIAMKLIERDATSGKYNNTSASKRFLVTTSPTTVNGLIIYTNNVSYLLWSHLDDAVRENSDRWKQTFGSGKDKDFHFDAIYRDENAQRMFMAGMHTRAVLSYPFVIATLDDLSQFKRLCDLGGCSAQLAVSACEAHANLEAIVFDLPRMEKHTLHYINQAPPAVRDRIHFQGGDFFADTLPQADLYSVARILHNWSDDKCRKLLTKVFDSLPQTNGAVLIVEKLLDDSKESPAPVIIKDLSMLVETDGKERTLQEYEALLKNVGFKEIKCHQTTGYFDAIVGYK